MPAESLYASLLTGIHAEKPDCVFPFAVMEDLFARLIDTDRKTA